jgi:hypothetical protein
LLAWFRDEGDRLSYRNFNSWRCTGSDAFQDPAGGGFQFGHSLVCLYFHDYLMLLDPVAFSCQPLDYAAGLHMVCHLVDEDFHGHALHAPYFITR